MNRKWQIVAWTVFALAEMSTLIVNSNGKTTQELTGFVPTTKVLPFLKKGAELQSKSAAVVRNVRGGPVGLK